MRGARGAGRRAAMLIAPLLVLVLGLALAAGPALVRAQEATPSPEMGALASGEVTQLPGPPDPGVEAWFFRVTLAPGGVLPASPEFGYTLYLVEQGAVTLTVDGALTVTHEGVARSASARDTAGSREIALGAGDSALSEPGTMIGGRNDGPAPVVVLVFAIFSPMAEVENEPGEGTVVPQPVGMTTQMLSVGRASLPEVPGTMRIERVTLAPGAPEAGRTEGVEIGTIERGSARLTVETGSVWVWPRVAALGPENEGIAYETVDPGASRAVAEHDGYVRSTGATATIEATGGVPVTILRAVVVPAGAATPTP